jgi:hypothetical protein
VPGTDFKTYRVYDVWPVPAAYDAVCKDCYPEGLPELAASGALWPELEREEEVPVAKRPRVEAVAAAAQDDGVGCGVRTEEPAGGVSLRMPGVFALAFPCGIVPWYDVMQRHEGPRLALHYLAQFMDLHRETDGSRRLQSFGYDNNCALEAVLAKLQRTCADQCGPTERGPVSLEALADVAKFIDAHHVAKHKQERCRTELHPDAVLAWHVNTEVVEQLWSRLNRHKAKLRNMSAPMFDFTLLCILHESNRRCSVGRDSSGPLPAESSSESSSSSEMS